MENTANAPSSGDENYSIYANVKSLNGGATVSVKNPVLLESQSSEDYNPTNAQPFHLGNSSVDNPTGNKIRFADDGMAMRESMIKDVDQMKQTSFIKYKNHLLAFTTISVFSLSYWYFQSFVATFIAPDCSS